QVQADRCTSCGLCAGSCASLAIGPEGRTARHQLAAARQLVARHGDHACTVAVVACRENRELIARLQRALTGHGALAWLTGDCAGELLPGTVQCWGGHFGGARVLACPPQNCLHRRGATLADARILGERRPAIPGRIAKLPVRFLCASASEWKGVVAAIDALGP